MKIIIVAVLALGLAGCEAARGLGALAYCIVHQGDANRRCT